MSLDHDVVQIFALSAHLSWALQRAHILSKRTLNRSTLAHRRLLLGCFLEVSKPVLRQWCLLGSAPKIGVHGSSVQIFVKGATHVDEISVATLKQDVSRDREAKSHDGAHTSVAGVVTSHLL